MTGKKKHVAIGLATAITATLAMTDAASADDVLHDTLWMTDNQTADHVLSSYINSFNDMNVTDDFSLDGTYNITTATGDFVTGVGQTWGGQGILIEFFADNAGEPSNSPAALYFATDSNGLTVSPITNPWGGNQGTMRFTVDLSSAGITLGEGTWWLSVVPVGEESNQTYRWIRQKNYQEDGGVHVRNGSEAHGNGLGGTYGWLEWGEYAGNFGPSSGPGDMAMRIEGTPAGKPKCASADLDCSGSVGVPDLLLLLADWGVCEECGDCAADLTGSCNVGVPDLLELLANWG